MVNTMKDAIQSLGPDDLACFHMVDREQDAPAHTHEGWTLALHLANGEDVELKDYALVCFIDHERHSKGF